MPKSASFDVLGTCFHFAPVIHLIDTILHHSNPTTPIDATTLFHSWFYAAQRDFTYLSLCNRYTPIARVLRGTFRRACSIVGFPEVQTNITDEDLDGIMREIRQLPAYEGLRECFAGLREAGWDVFAVTNGGAETSLKYFELAGVPLDGDHLVSCDEIEGGVAKPDSRVYERMNTVLESRGCEKSERWFVAAHAWDLAAARSAGFRTAWVAHEEGEVSGELFGEFDVVARDLRECMEMMKAAA